MTNTMKKRKNQDRLYYTICYIITALLTIVVLYPIIYIISASFSSPENITNGEVWLLPVEPSLISYERILAKSEVWVGYANTIFYTVVGTVINIVITLMCAYPMARKNLRGRGAIMFFFSFTMMFSGGMIPNYILMRNLGLLGSRWAVILPGAMSVYNMIVCRTFIESNIPDEMLEAAQIDGCNNTQFFFRMVLPLVKPIIAVLALWYGVSHWNSYFNAFLYLNDVDKYPLQIVLREILVQGAREATDPTKEALLALHTVTGLKFAIIVVSSAPLMCLYPFVQKHFQKGVLIGSVKG